MKFDAAGMDQDVVDKINQNIARIEGWLGERSPSIRGHEPVVQIVDEQYTPLKKFRKIAVPRVLRRRDLELENLLGHAKSVVPFPPFILP